MSSREDAAEERIEIARQVLVDEVRATVQVQPPSVAEALDALDQAETLALTLFEQLKKLEDDDFETFSQRMAEAGLELAAAELIEKWDALAFAGGMPASAGLMQKWGQVATAVNAIEETLQAILGDKVEITPRCDLCSRPQPVEGEDWNPENGNHVSCESRLPDREKVATFVKEMNDATAGIIGAALRRVDPMEQTRREELEADAVDKLLERCGHVDGCAYTFRATAPEMAVHAALFLANGGPLPACGDVEWWPHGEIAPELPVEA